MSDQSEHHDLSDCQGEKSDAIRDILSRLGDTWSMIIIVTLSRRPNKRARFSELEKILKGVSQRMLSLTLKNLEKDGFIIREVFPEVPPRVEYELTPHGESFLMPFQSIVDWVSNNWDQIKTHRTK